MYFFEYLNQCFTRIIGSFKDIKFINLFLYLLISITVCGFLFGIVEFIERSYSLGYVLSFKNKIQGLLFNTSILSLELTLVFIPLLLIFILMLYLTGKANKEFKVFNINFNSGLTVFSGMISLIITLFLKYQCFDYYNKTFFSKYILQSEIFSSIFSSLIIAVLICFLLNILAFKLYKTKGIPIKKLCLITNSFGLIVFVVCLIIVPISKILIELLNSLYQQVNSLYQISNILSLLVIFILILVILYVIIANIIIFTSLFIENKLFKICYTLLVFILFAFSYLVTVNFLFSHFNFVTYYAGISLICAIIASLFFYILTIIFLNLAGFSLETVKAINKKKFIAKYLVILVILFILTLLLKPNDNVLKAFVYRNIIIHKGLINLKLKPALKMLQKANATLPISNMCKGNNNEQITLDFDNKPNVILVSIDAMRYDYSIDHKFMKNLNDLANHSYIFENCYSHGSHTASSFASIFISKYFASIKHYNYLSLAEVISNNNYETFAISGNNLFSEKIPINIIEAEGNKHKTPIIKGFKSFSMVKYQLEHTEIADKMVVSFFNKYVDSYVNSNKPIFGWLHFFEPHDTPVKLVFDSILFKSPFENEYLRRLVLADNNLGGVLQILKSKKLYDKSVIIVFADHGDEIKDHGGFYHKYSLYNELIHVPLLIKMPYQKKKIEIDTPVSLLDIYPTVVQITGVTENKIKNLCGESLLPLMFGFNKDHKLPLSAIYLGRVDEVKEKPAISAVKINNNPSEYYFDELYKISIVDKNNEWKLIYNLEPEFYELYNLKQDPKEKNNLADTEIEKVDELVNAMNNQINSK